MGIFDFAKKKEEPIAAAPRIPINEILRMRQQGLSNNQIVQALQRAGFQPHQIYDAFTQADMRPGAAVPEDLTNLEMPPTPPGLDEQPAEEYPAEQPEPTAKIEELTEAIIEEKWQDLMKDFNKITEWKGAMEQRLSVLEQRFTDLKGGFDILQKSVIDKVDDYDKSVQDVGTEMKALEQVFQKIIPTLTENVNELSRITKDLKPKKAKPQ